MQALHALRAYLRGARADATSMEPPAVDSAEAECVSWKASAHRAEGPDGYVFGDMTRGVVARCLGPTRDTEVEREGDESFSRLQRLVREAIGLYRARGYIGTISISHTVGAFTESCSVRVDDAPADAPSEAGGVGEDDASAGTTAQRVFETLLARLERRARGWDAYFSGLEGLDPMLTSSAQVGFRAPVLNVGWGVSVSFTISQFSLLRWATRVTNKRAAVCG